MNKLSLLAALASVVIVSQAAFGQTPTATSTPKILSAVAAQSPASLPPARGDRAVAMLKGYVENGVFREMKAATPVPSKSKPSAIGPNYDYRIHDKISRYTNTAIYGLTEYNPTTCDPISQGAWTLTHTEQFGTATLSTFTGHPAGGPCTDHTYTFATVYYRWSEHTNKTQQPDPGGPIDIFTGEWKTPDGIYDTVYEFDIMVAPVRPKGETNTFESWNEAKGRWRVTLVPPDNDPNFDFTGETIRETYLTDNDSCIGSGASKPNQTTVVNGPPGNFGDSVGYSACGAEYARVKKRTRCGYRIDQRMEISAPSDSGAFTQYSQNTLSAAIDGRVIYSPGQLSVGQVFSQRVTPLSSQPVVSKSLVTNRLDCATNLLLLLDLQ